jgi:hypothetical protein
MYLYFCVDETQTDDGISICRSSCDCDDDFYSCLKSVSGSQENHADKLFLHKMLSILKIYNNLMVSMNYILNYILFMTIDDFLLHICYKIYNMYTRGVSWVEQEIVCMHIC